MQDEPNFGLTIYTPLFFYFKADFQEKCANFAAL